MPRPHTRLLLWIGPKHSGKTTAAAGLVERARAEGIRVAGILSPSVCRENTLAGFDVVDLDTGARAPLARRCERGTVRAGSFAFSAEGLEQGCTALASSTTRSAELVVVDEFGPLELRGQGWRAAVDALLSSVEGVVLLVVRERLAARVRRLYAHYRPRTLAAARRGSVDRVLTMLSERRSTRGMAGRIVSVNVSGRRHVAKAPVAEAELRPDHGLVGDAHAAPGERQVSLLAIESIDEQSRAFLRGAADGQAASCPKVRGSLGPGALSENLDTEGLDLSALPTGTRLRVGRDVVLEVTITGRECYRYCEVYRRLGGCAMPHQTIFARVTSGGVVRSGDGVRIEQPPAPAGP